MRIIFVTTHLTVFVGGGKFLMEYANEFSKHGHQVVVVVQKINFAKYKFNKHVTTIEVGGNLPTNPLHWLFFNSIKNGYLKALNSLSGDVIVSLGFPTNYFSALSSIDNKIPYIYYCLEPFRYFYDEMFYTSASFFAKITYRLLSLFFSRYDKKGAVEAKQIICISNFVRKQVLKIYGRESKVHHIGINTNLDTKLDPNFNFRQNLNLKDDSSPIIFTLGMVHHLKGEQELISIFHKIIEKIPNAILLIGGWRTKRNEKIMKKMCKRLNIPIENIIFYGFIEPDLLDLFYQKARITVYTAINESYGYIPLESMKNGTPVIAFEGGPSDTVVDGKTGYVIKNLDLDDFAQKAVRLIKDELLRKQFSEAAKLHIENNFSIERSYKDLEKILQEAIDK